MPVARDRMCQPDARALAHCAEAVRPVPRPLPEAQAQELSASWVPLPAHRDADGRENRLSSVPTGLHPRIQAHIRWLEHDRRNIDTAVGRCIRTSPVWRAKADPWPSVPGVGPVSRPHPVAQWPELGTLTRQRIAALVGVASLNRDRGTLRGRRSVWGGRACARATLSMERWLRCATIPCSRPLVTTCGSPENLRKSP